MLTDVLPTDYPDKLIAAGKFKRIPLLNGNQDDEGTLLTRGASSNLTTDAHFESWIKEQLIPGITNDQFTRLAKLYPSDPNVGSPYGTGMFNQVNG